MKEYIASTVTTIVDVLEVSQGQPAAQLMGRGLARHIALCLDAAELLAEPGVDFSMTKWTPQVDVVERTTAVVLVGAASSGSRECINLISEDVALEVARRLEASNMLINPNN